MDSGHTGGTWLYKKPFPDGTHANQVLLLPAVAVGAFLLLTTHCLSVTAELANDRHFPRSSYS